MKLKTNHYSTNKNNTDIVVKAENHPVHWLNYNPSQQFH